MEEKKTEKPMSFGKTIVEGWGYDSERCPHTHIKQFPKLYCKLCMAAAIDTALAAARQEEREACMIICDEHIRHIELSPGVGDAAQRYGIACIEDVITAIRARRP